MNVIAVVEDAAHVCCRYRLAAYRHSFEQVGHHVRLWPRPRGLRDWWRLGRELRQADVVILLRKLLGPLELRLLRARSRFLAYDFDDAVFLRNSFSRKGLNNGRRLRRFAATVQAADLVIAGNDFLRDRAAAYAEPGRVHVVPTCVDEARYALAEHAGAAGQAELVWIGSSSTLRALERFRPLLEGVGQQVPGLRLKIVCDRFLEFRHLPVVACPWSEAGEVAALATADVGISWLPDDPWSQGKCGLKVLQYMAAGLPVVANPVGVHPELIRHGETGFLAETPGQWVEAVSRLAQDPDLRRRLGAAGRRRLETEFSVTTGARRWLSLLEKKAA